MVSGSNPHPLLVARTRERFSLRQLASVTGLNHTRICSIEHGTRPSQIEARLLAAALRIPLAELLPRQSTEARHAS